MKKTILIFIILNIVLHAFSQEALFQKKEFVYKGDTLKYQVLFPENYNINKKYPLVLFLHGSGERGNDNELQLTHGSSMFLNAENREKYPAIIIFPQCPSDEYWVEISRANNQFSFPENPKISTPMLLTKKLLDYYVKNEEVDKNRIYVMGLSMGGMGTFDLICRYPKYFAAAVPICGGVNTTRMKKVKNLPIRIFHGGADPVVNKQFSIDAYNELKKEGSTKVEYIEFPGVGHNSWDSAFTYPDFMKWVFKQKK